MSRVKIYQVIHNFESNKNYGIKLDQRVRNTLSEFKKGDMFRPKDIVAALPKSNQTLAYDTISLGMKIGVLKLVESEPTKFDDF